MPDIPNATPTNYNSSYTGPQIDAAVGAVLDKEASWDEAVAGKLPAGGEIGQVLEKTGAEDNAADWRTPPFLTRPNLLDNWYFVGGGSQLGDGVFPINQRGQTAYTGAGGIIDRWKMANAGATVTLGTTGLTVAPTTSLAEAYRIIETHLPALSAGKYTVSILVDDVSAADAFRLCFGSIGTSANRVTPAITGPGLFSATYDAPAIRDPFVGLINRNVSAKSIKIKAIKLELGSTQTLAHQENGVWVLNELPDYGEELAKCQRYFKRLKSNVAFGNLCLGFVYGNTKRVFASLPCGNMVKTPTIAISAVADFGYSYPGVGVVQNDVTGVTIGNSSSGLDSIVLNFAINTERTMGDPAQIWISNGGYLDLIAE